MTIDVIIPAYNCCATLPRTLASLASQTDNRFNVIVVDDFSSESLIDVVQQYEGTLNIKYIRNNCNVGCGMSRQVGIDESTAEYFCFLDADDMFMPYTIQIFHEVISNDNSIELLYGPFYVQEVIDGKNTLRVQQDGFTWCHGKLYNAARVKELGIRNMPCIKYADDSFFNSICFELMRAKQVKIPLYLYADNPKSVMRKIDVERDQNKVYDFVLAMYESCKFVLKYKPTIDHLEYTFEHLRQCDNMPHEAFELYTELEKIYKKQSTYNKNNNLLNYDEEVE